jgi:hypothetical protein
MACVPLCCGLSSTLVQVTRMNEFMPYMAFNPYIYPLAPPRTIASVPHFPSLSRLATSSSPNNPSRNQPDPISDPILCVRIHRRLRPGDWICRSSYVLIAIYRTHSIISRSAAGLGTSNSTISTGQNYTRMRKVKFQASWQHEEASHHL